MNQNRCLPLAGMMKKSRTVTSAFSRAHAMAVAAIAEPAPHIAAGSARWSPN